MASKNKKKQLAAFKNKNSFSKFDGFANDYLNIKPFANHPQKFDENETPDSIDESTENFSFPFLYIGYKSESDKSGSLKVKVLIHFLSVFDLYVIVPRKGR